MSRISRTLLVVTFVAAATGWFLFGTVLMDEVPKPWLVVVSALSASIAAVALTFGDSRREPAGTLRSLAVPASIGVLMLFVAPAVLLANRLTDAPPGSEVLFFTTAVWGVLGVFGAVVLRSQRPTLQGVAFALIGLLGAAALLANWERPSSFSPLIRYAEQEVGFLVAGAAWVAGTLLLVSSRQYRDRRSLLAAAGAATVVSVVYALSTAGVDGLRTFALHVTPLAVLGVSFAAMVAAWVALTGGVGPVRANAVWFLPPLAVTGLAVVEQSLSPRGPDPVVWAGALGGSALIAIGAVGLWAPASAGTAATGEVEPARSAPALLSVGAVVSLLLGAVSLVRPAFDASVVGTLSSGKAYSAAWEMLGFEAAGGWIPVVAGALLLAGVFGLPRARALTTTLVSVASVAVIAVYPVLASTPLHTWNGWVPVEIQSEYGTEYALLEMTVIHDPVRLAALAVTGLTAVVLLVLGVRNLRRAETASEGVS